MGVKHTFFICIIIFVVGFSLNPLYTHAYNQHTTHSELSNQSVDFFNYNFPALEISDEDKELLIKGTVIEDTPVNRNYSGHNITIISYYKKGLPIIFSR